MRLCLGLSRLLRRESPGFQVFHFEGAVPVADDFERHYNLFLEYMDLPVLKIATPPLFEGPALPYHGDGQFRKQMSEEGRAILAAAYPDVAPPVEPEQPPLSTRFRERILTDDELFAMMKESPEFDFLPKPATWYKKYGLEPVKPRNFKEYLDDDAYFESRAKYVSEKVIFKGPQPGGVRPVPPPEVIPVEITQRPVAPSECWGVEEENKTGNFIEGCNKTDGLIG